MRRLQRHALLVQVRLQRVRVAPQHADQARDRRTGRQLLHQPAGIGPGAAGLPVEARETDLGAGRVEERRAVDGEAERRGDGG